MKLRWMLVAVGLAVAMTAVAALSMRSSVGVDPAATGAPEGAGCPVKAHPANLAFTLKDMYGRAVKLSDYRGKVVLLNFWATWCGPCQAEIPGFVDLQARYKKR
jgi:thiol-disulfide isomerase/thioredoxin